jgi:hypothetical protein
MMLETVTQNQSIAIMVIITTSATFGLILVGLVVQAMNYVRLCKLMTRMETTEARLLARMMMIETKDKSDMLSLGVPATLKDLIKRDLEENFQEHPGNLVSPTDEELERILKDVYGHSKS